MMINFKSLPHKFLFYLGFFTVILFLGLSYWQFTRYKTNQTIKRIKSASMLKNGILRSKNVISKPLRANEENSVGISLPKIVLPPLGLLSQKDEKKLMSELKKLDFYPEKNIAA